MSDLPTLIIEGPQMGSASITGTTSGLQALIEVCQRALKERVVITDMNDHCDQLYADGFTLVIRCNERAGYGPMVGSSPDKT